MHMLAILVVLNRWVRGTRGAHRRRGITRLRRGPDPGPRAGQPRTAGFPGSMLQRRRGSPPRGHDPGDAVSGWRTAISSPQRPTAPGAAPATPSAHVSLENPGHAAMNRSKVANAQTGRRDRLRLLASRGSRIPNREYLTLMKPSFFLFFDLIKRQCLAGTQNPAT